MNMNKIIITLTITTYWCSDSILALLVLLLKYFNLRMPDRGNTHKKGTFEADHNPKQVTGDCDNVKRIIEHCTLNVQYLLANNLSFSTVHSVLSTRLNWNFRCLTLAEPKIDAVCSSLSSSSFLGWMIRVTWQELLVANFLKTPIMWSWTANLNYMRTLYFHTA